MPLTDKGRKIMGALTDTYGGQQGERVFYASKNKGKISGVDRGGGRSRGKKFTKGGRATARRGR